MKFLQLKTPRRLVVACAVFFLSFSFASADPIEGQWVKSTGDVVIEVKMVDGDLVGLLVSWAETDRTEDSHNPDKSLRKRPLKGIPVLWDLVKKGERWEGGQIYDASDGKSYKAKLKFVGENEIELRAYVGTPLFGKTIKWTRKLATD